MVAWWSTVAVARGGYVTRDRYLAQLDGLGANPILNRAIVVDDRSDAAAIDAAVTSFFDAHDAGTYGVLDAFDRVPLDACGWDRSGSVPIPEMTFMPAAAAPATSVDIREVTNLPALAD